MRRHKLTMNQLKKAQQHGKTFALGGKTPMFKQQAAGPDKPGNTGKDAGPAPGSRRAVGGPSLPPKVSAARPAKRA